MNYYDRAYFGKETYGSRHVAKSSIKPGSNKMKAKIKYYIFKDAVERDEFDVPLEFEVHARIIKDSDGNDIQVFVKEDKALGLRRDSSFYWDGEWKVFEINDISKEVSLRTSSGARSLRKYDNENRLTENYLINEKGDTLISEQYEWKNGRLIRMVEDGMERVYIYGNKITDTIRVVPSDEGVRFHSGYNETAGKIPDENDPMYKFFIMDPYRYNDIEENEELSVYYSIPKNFILMKLPEGGSIDGGCAVKYPGMPKLDCIRYTKEHVLQKAKKEYPYPNKKNIILYGESNAELPKKYDCECVNRKYNIKYNGPVNEYIQVMKSGWRYNKVKKDWEESCWTKEEMKSTYYHEATHIEFSRDMARELYLESFIDTIFDTEKECTEKADRQLSSLRLKWGVWYQMEKEHDTQRWKEEMKRRPFGQYRAGVPCPN